MEFFCNTIEDLKTAFNYHKSSQGDIFICSDEVFDYLMFIDITKPDEGI